MIINFNNYNLEDFHKKLVKFCDQDAWLIYPSEVGLKWTQENKIFRSSIWSLDGELLSAGFPKFTNLGENPENFPIPISLDNSKIISKEDGTLMIVDFYNNQLNLRTRGTVSYKTLDNFRDFDFVLNKYPEIRKLAKDVQEKTWLFELVTPNQKIVLNYGSEPDCFLIGAINKEDYSMTNQRVLDGFADLRFLKRPAYYSFSDLDLLISFFKDAVKIEGCCIYSNKDQDIHKLKTDYYLRLHRLKSSFRSFKFILEWYVYAGCPAFDLAHNIISNTIDFEIAEDIKSDLLKLSSAAQEMNLLINKLNLFINSIRELDRKSQAILIIENYKSFSGVAFTLLDNKEINDKQKIKILNDIIEKSSKLLK